MSQNVLMQAIASEQRHREEGAEFVCPDLKPPYSVTESLELFEKLICTNFASIVPITVSDDTKPLGKWIAGGAVRAVSFSCFNNKHILRPENLTTLTMDDVAEIYRRLGLCWSNESFTTVGASIIFNAWLLGYSLENGGFNPKKVYQASDKFELLIEHQTYFNIIWPLISGFGLSLLKPDKENAHGGKILISADGQGRAQMVGSLKPSFKTTEALGSGEINMIMSRAFGEMLAILSLTVRSIFCSLDKDSMAAIVGGNARSNLNGLRELLVFFYGAAELRTTLFEHRAMIADQLSDLDMIQTQVARNDAYNDLFENSRYIELVKLMCKQTETNNRLLND